MIRVAPRRPLPAGARAALGPLSRVLGAPGSTMRSRNVYLLAVFAPVMALFLIIRALPIAAVLGLAFTNYNLIRPGRFRFIGIDNFASMLQDPLIADAFRNSFTFVLFSVPAVIVIAFAFATLVNRRIRFEGLFQTLYFLPFILPIVPTTIIWRWVYAPGKFGLANGMLQQLGISSVPWLFEPAWAIAGILIMYIWKNVGLYVVIFLVGLKAIPKELREAAAIDGGTAWQTVRAIDLPLMKPIFLYAVVISTIQAWSIFTEVYVMTQGSDASAGTSLQVLAIQIFQEGFSFNKMGYASAISLLLFVVSLIFVIVQLRLLRPSDAR